MKIFSGLVLVSLLASCGTDKLLHIGAGVGISGATMAVGGSWQDACKISIVGGIAKEAYDSTGRGTVDPMDAVATGAAGCALAYFLRN